jgi:hypothetical protein
MLQVNVIHFKSYYNAVSSAMLTMALHMGEHGNVK